MTKTKNKHKLIVVVLAVWLGIGVIQNTIIPSFAGCVVEYTRNTPIAEDWKLMLVNPWNRIPENHAVVLTELSNGQKVDNRIYPYLQLMFDDARKEGVYATVSSGYRTNEEQQQFFNDKVQAYLNEGYSKAKAKKMAQEWVALPGTSEHQIGIAVDINADLKKSTKDEVYTWFADNAHKYGFILRYPLGKTDITGIQYEPWHFRYVGVENAQVIYENQLCLEEFLNLNKKL